MKRIYQKPTAEIVEFAYEDHIVASGGCPCGTVYSFGYKGCREKKEYTLAQ